MKAKLKFRNGIYSEGHWTIEAYDIVSQIEKNAVNILVDIPCLPTIGMFICLLDFDKYYKFTEEQSDVLDADPFYIIKEIGIAPDCIELVLDPETWDENDE